MGATLLDGVHAVGPGVSILAHPERWALPVPLGGLVAHDCSSCSVSILAHPERWALPAKEDPTVVDVLVSILAHPERWALLDTFRRNVALSMFQSSPTPKGGRYHFAETETYGLSAQVVSILAHPERWALRSR